MSSEGERRVQGGVAEHDIEGPSVSRSRSRAATALLPTFIARRERDVTALVAAIERGDFELIARLGHNMRGNGASYGFPEIGVIGERLEAAAKERNGRLVADHVASLGAWVARIRDLLPVHS